MTTPSVSTFDLYSRPEYFQDLIDCAAKLRKGDSMTLMTMNFDPQVSLIGELMDALSQAAIRGVEIRLIVDAMDFVQDQNGVLGPLFYGKPLSEKITGTALYKYQKLEKLRADGGHYWVINQPAHAFSLPIAGRSHIKLALINHRVYLGGCNLDSADCIDIMVGWNDVKTAQWLYALTEQIVASGNVKKALRGADITHEVDDNLTIYVDSGIRKQSVIYKQALQLIDEANSEAYITCQFFPGGPTAKHLLAAQKRGADVTIIYNNPNKHRQPLRQKIYNLRERFRLPASFFKDELPVSEQKLHAKVIATESGALIGSQNYVDIGVKLGTAEIAFLVHGPQLSKRVISKITSLSI
jgi:phosphatidylserine/phosphatidylglycerophosphate/cardiolipin synthase-like enzyme